MKALKISKLYKIIITIVIIAALITVGCVVYFAKPQVEETYPKNKNGLTYGSALYAENDDEVPDLVQVKGKYGNYGYIYKDDYLLNTINDYEKYTSALSASELESTRELYKNEYDDVSNVDFYHLCYDVPVYDEYGEKIIDTYTFLMGPYPYP